MVRSANRLTFAANSGETPFTAIVPTITGGEEIEKLIAVTWLVRRAHRRRRNRGLNSFVHQCLLQHLDHAVQQRPLGGNLPVIQRELIVIRASSACPGASGDCPGES